MGLGEGTGMHTTANQRALALMPPVKKQSPETVCNLSAVSRQHAKVAPVNAVAEIAVRAFMKLVMPTCSRT